VDGTSVYFEDDGGSGVPIVLYGGIVDSVDSVRASQLAGALQELTGEFRLVYADHRGLGRSDRHHETEAYAMPLQVADFVAVLTALGIEKAHLVGRSYGGRLAFGVGEHAPERTLSLVSGGQQPYAINPDGPLIRSLSEGIDATRREGAVRFVEALEAYWGASIPAFERDVYLGQDGASVAAAFEAMLASGDLSTRLHEWRVPCLIYLGVGDGDFFTQAQQAAAEIPDAEFVGLDALDHVSAHYEADRILPAVIRTLRTNS
jgi:pimeloyl-ACP methyl ester carboxylesterase